ncbi:ABC transporter ATP-binding protein [Pinisolibacter sp.]|uniref:ABC transporter ATP-binding protein n=1 Tax=Pinisolibacter sp. TaxID=2172024 RepID=UPI002FDD29D4
MADPVLVLDQVKKSYAVGTAVEVEVLHGLDLRLEQGEFVALIGPSGSGKSTLLNLIGLLDRPSAGRLILHGEDATTLDDSELTRLRGRAIGFVFQYHYLISAFSAVENVAMPMLLDRGFPTDAMFARADELLAQFHLSQWRNQPVMQLSGGQQQRVAIARALAMNPALVLADEPTGNLDTRSADRAFDLMREINETRRTTFLVVTHDPRLARRCDRIVELIDGRFTADRPNVAVREEAV